MLPADEPAPPVNRLDEFLDTLDLDRLDRDRFRGEHPPAVRQRMFGGVVLAQGLVAASRTVEARPAHSLHAYFRWRRRALLTSEGGQT